MENCIYFGKKNFGADKLKWYATELEKCEDLIAMGILRTFPKTDVVIRAEWLTKEIYRLEKLKKKSDKK